MLNAENFIQEEFEQISKDFIALKSLAPVINHAADACIKAIQNNNKIMFCGNGGSAADAQHLAAELVGRYKINRKAIASIALTTDTSILTAVANDFGYDTVFSRQVEALGNRDDVLIGISTSGNSPNIIKAFEAAKGQGVTTIALTGQKGGKMLSLADYIINVPSDTTNLIQTMHIAVGHILCDLIEKSVK
ncbi:MAG: D-sedoheptulose 7-phosphate isomerase [Alphaproteobacteria bacterium]|nr:D-sedoheptulose 7-phosphate isomerase [Alphaproteobacteria bacterium]MCL2505786.1 D-sedoheptulose 7-phosphate isomerase [Alphaproteobacteria bacterium]